MKMLAPVLALCLFTLCLTPATGLGWHGHRPYYPRYHHSHHSHGDAWVWGLSGLILGGALVAALTPPVVYAESPRPIIYNPPPAPIYTYPPAVPPGMCRWERYVLDGYGNQEFDQNGQPIKEYTLGSCQYPPN